MFRLASLFDLTGRSAVVTGGNSGLGLAMARALGLAGGRVVLVARREAELRGAVESLRTERIDAAGVPADLVTPEAGRIVASACERIGFSIDILVNAAGINLRQPFGGVVTLGK